MTKTLVGYDPQGVPRIYATNIPDNFSDRSEIESRASAEGWSGLTWDRTVRREPDDEPAADPGSPDAARG
jgi:hypothetical protein